MCLCGGAERRGAPPDAVQHDQVGDVVEPLGSGAEPADVEGKRASIEILGRDIRGALRVGVQGGDVGKGERTEDGRLS